MQILLAQPIQLMLMIGDHAVQLLFQGLIVIHKRIAIMVIYPERLCAEKFYFSLVLFNLFTEPIYL